MNLDELQIRAGAAEKLLKAMASQPRLMILCELLKGERTVTALQQAVGLSMSAISQHLAPVARGRTGHHAPGVADDPLFDRERARQEGDRNPLRAFLLARRDRQSTQSRGERVVTIDRAVMAFAGLVVLVSLALAQTQSPLWLLLTAFAGLNLIQASFTGFCPAAMVFKRLGVKPGNAFR